MVLQDLHLPPSFPTSVSVSSPHLLGLWLQCLVNLANMVARQPAPLSVPSMEPALSYSARPHGAPRSSPMVRSIVVVSHDARHDALGFQGMGGGVGKASLHLAIFGCHHQCVRRPPSCSKAAEAFKHDLHAHCYMSFDPNHRESKCSVTPRDS
jgi:hypothetical protein